MTKREITLEEASAVWHSAMSRRFWDNLTPARRSERNRKNALKRWQRYHEAHPKKAP